MPSNTPQQTFILSELQTFLTFVANYSGDWEKQEPTLADVLRMLAEELARIAYEEAMDAYLACLARQAAFTALTGLTVDLGCAAP